MIDHLIEEQPDRVRDLELGRDRQLSPGDHSVPQLPFGEEDRADRFAQTDPLFPMVAAEPLEVQIDARIPLFRAEPLPQVVVQGPRVASEDVGIGVVVVTRRRRFPPDGLEPGVDPLPGVFRDEAGGDGSRGFQGQEARMGASKAAFSSMPGSRGTR